LGENAEIVKWQYTKKKYKKWMFP